jgi:hypothetical protein
VYFFMRISPLNHIQVYFFMSISPLNHSQLYVFLRIFPLYNVQVYFSWGFLLCFVFRCTFSSNIVRLRDSTLDGFLS